MRKPVLSRALIILGIYIVPLFMAGAQKKETPQPGPAIPEKFNTYRFADHKKK